MKAMRRFSAHVRRRLGWKISLMYGALVVIPILIVGIVNIRFSAAESERLVIANVRQSIQQQLSGIDALYERMNDIAVEIMMRSDLKNAFKNYDGKITGNSLAQYNYIKEQLTTILVRQEGLRDVVLISPGYSDESADERQYILSTGNAFVSSRARIGDQPWFKMIQQNPDAPLFLYSSHYSFSSKNVGLGEESVITFVCSFTDISVNRKCGIIVLTLPERRLEKALTDFGDSTFKNRLVTDALGSVVLFDGEDQRIRETLISREPPTSGDTGKALKVWNAAIGGEDYLMVNGVSAKSGFRIQYALDRGEVFRDVSRISLINTAVVVVSLLLTLVLMALIFRSFLGPVKRLQSAMNLVQKGDLKARAEASSDDEIGRLTQDFNRMVDSIEAYNRGMIEQEEKKRSFELMALQAQINPHFLYNTLDSIRWMAMAQGSKTIEKMSYSLIQLLRKTISSGSPFATMEEELRSLENYVDILRLRYYNSFDYEATADPAVLSCQIPKLILQPLVENALLHGVYDCGHKGHIRVSAERSGDDLLVRVRDDGRGMDPGALKRGDRDAHKDSFSGIGIENVDERIKLYYGAAYGVSFESALGEFTEATVRIPRVAALAKEAD
jgi:two-component system sensor histidine kinase YesM